MGRIGGALAALAALVTTVVVAPGAGVEAERDPLVGTPDPVAIALAHLAADSAATASFGATDEPALRVTDVVPTEHNGVTNVYVQQERNGIPVVGAVANVAVSDAGEVIHAPSSIVTPSNDAAAAPSASPSLSSVDAASHAAAALGLTPTDPFEIVDAATGDEQVQALSHGGIANGPIPARLVFATADAGTRSEALALAWEFTVDVRGGHDVWVIRIDATTGAELSRHNLTVHESFGVPAFGSLAAPAALAEAHPGTDVVETPGVGPIEVLATGPAAPGVDDGSAYRVYAADVASPLSSTPVAPSDGRVLVENPADPTASPFGWHDVDGVAGADHTVTRGNNVFAFVNSDGFDTPDADEMVDGGSGLSFDTALDLADEPADYASASVVNLFHATNVMHDFLYAYGFDEEAGNFQENNYGNGGAAFDPVSAQAHDSVNHGAYNNATFYTPDDGNSGVMRMFLWNLTSPERDGSLINEIIYHEYGHGLSTRLTGGPTSSVCLANAEQAGEGWSDYVALIATMQADDLGTDSINNGAYAVGNGLGGPGVRQYPYSTDLAINPHTYDSIKGAFTVHQVGVVWAAMLWDLTWLLIDEYGFSPDLAHGDGGNNRAMQLVVDGMKMQACSPGFIDSRSGILSADAANGGEDECLIWTAFARRGLGYSAWQGDPDRIDDGVEAFDLPTWCDIGVEKTASASAPETGGGFSYSVAVTNLRMSAQTNVTVVDTLPAGIEYVDGSASCPVTVVGDTLTFDLGDMQEGADRTCSYDVTVTGGPSIPVTVFEDGFDPDASAWLAEHGPGLSSDWSLDSTSPRTGSNAMYADNLAANGVSDQYLTTAVPVPVTLGTELRFWHEYAFEWAELADGPAYFDGGVVEVYVVGVGWFAVDDLFIQGGYDGRIDADSGNPIGGFLAFRGAKPGYSESVVDLSDFAGDDVYIRFRMGTDSSNEEPGIVGWSIDDVSIVNTGHAVNRADVFVDGSPRNRATSIVPVFAATVTTAPLNPVAAAHDGSATVTWDAPASVAAGGSVPTEYTVTASPGGATCSTSTLSCTASGLTNGTSHTFTVTADNAAGTSPTSVASNAVTPLSPPAVVVGPADGQDDPTSASSVLFSIEFEQPVTGFDSTDLVVGGTAGAVTAVVTGSGASYEATVGGMTDDGTVTLQVVSAAGVNPNGSTSIASNTSTVVYDTTAPAFTTRPQATVTTETDPGKSTAVVNFTVTAEDLQPAGGAAAATFASAAQVVATVPVSCTPASGSEFAIGTTPVACTATDAAGNLASAAFDVQVTDREDPVIANTGDQTFALSTGPSGPVSFTVPSATDNSGTVAVTCSPESGAVLSEGQTPVTCTATDPSGNTSRASFVVTVTAPAPAGQLPATGNGGLPIREALVATLAGLALLLAGRRRRSAAQS